MGNMVTAHIYGRNKRGDREAVRLKLFDMDGEPVDISQPGIGNVTTVASSGVAYTFPTPTPDSIVDVTLSADCTLSMPVSSPPAGTSFTVVLRQDETGSRVITWPVGLKWPNGYAPLLTPTPETSDIFVFTRLADAWFAFPAGYDVR